MSGPVPWWRQPTAAAPTRRPGRPGGTEIRSGGGSSAALALVPSATSSANRLVMTGHAARFNEWAKIRDRDGEFLERIAPGTFRNAIRSHAAGRPVKVLFQHGKDPSIGEKPLGPVEKLHEDDRGLFYAVRLLDTSYNRDLAQLLEAGLLGASFRFRVKSEDYVARPRRSEWNPDALPERTIRDVALSEFGPVTFPAYPSASATIDATTGLAAVPEPPPRRSARTQPDVPRAWRADRREPAAQRPRAWQPLETRRAR